MSGHAYCPAEDGACFVAREEDCPAFAEPYAPEPDPEPEPYRELAPARCPECGVILRRVSLDEHRCPEHGVVRPWYGKP